MREPTFVLAEGQVINRAELDRVSLVERSHGSFQSAVASIFRAGAAAESIGVGQDLGESVASLKHQRPAGAVVQFENPSIVERVSGAVAATPCRIYCEELRKCAQRLIYRLRALHGGVGEVGVRRSKTRGHRRCRRDVRIKQADGLRDAVFRDHRRHDAHRHLIDVHQSGFEARAVHGVVIGFDGEVFVDLALYGERPVIVFGGTGGILAIPPIDVAVVGE